MENNSKKEAILTTTDSFDLHPEDKIEIIINIFEGMINDLTNDSKDKISYLIDFIKNTRIERNY